MTESHRMDHFLKYKTQIERFHGTACTNQNREFRKCKSFTKDR